jgi:hypothetical protein
LVIGGDNGRREAHVARTATAPRPSEPPQYQLATSEELEVEKLLRSKRTEPIVDVFANKVLPLSVPAPVPIQAATPEPAAPAPPSAPPALPFRFVGKFVENGVMRLLLANGDKEHDIKGGETLEGTYRVDSVSEESVLFTYLPLNVSQTLPLTPASEAPR